MTNGKPIVRWIWAAGSAIGLVAGAYIAVSVFPEAGFAMNPTGQFGWNLVGFAAIVAAALALVQWLMLWSFLPGRGVVRLFWLPATVAGVMAMVLPLWWYDASLFMLMPWVVLLATLPGTALLAGLQGLLVWAATGAGFRWFIFTVLGGVIGGVGGLIGALLLQPAPVELSWALLLGLATGYFQGVVLDELRQRRL